MNNKPPRRTSDRANNLEKEQRRSLSTERMCEKVKSYKGFSKKEFKDKRTVNKIDKREHFQNFVKETTNNTMNNNKINFADINNEIIDANTEFYVSKETANDKPKTPPPPIIGPIEVGSPNGLFFSTTNTEIEDWIRFIPLPISPENEVNDNETSLEDFESLHMSISSGDSPLKPSSPCVEMFQSIPTTHSDRESSFNSDLENNKESYLPSAQNTECKVFNNPIEEIWDQKVNKLLKKTREKWEQEALAKGKDINKQELKFDGKNIDSDVDDVSDYPNKGICYCRTRIEKKLDWRDVLKLEENAEEHSKVNAEVDAERDLEEKEVKLDASSPTIQSNSVDNQHAVTTLPINKPREKLTMCLATFLEEEDHDCQKVKESGKKCVMVTFVT